MQTRCCFRQSPRASVALVLVCMLAACGGGDDGDSAEGTMHVDPRAAGGIDPCTLVSAEEAQTALGGAVGEPERPPEANIPPRLATCRYVAQGDHAAAVLTITIHIATHAQESRIGFESAREPFPAAQRIADLADDAFWIGDQLHVLSEEVYFIIGGVELDRAKALAGSALGRIRRAARGHAARLRSGAHALRAEERGLDHPRRNAPSRVTHGDLHCHLAARLRKACFDRRERDVLLEQG